MLVPFGFMSSDAEVNTDNYNFTLSAPAMVSAGVYDSDDYLLRVLFQGEYLEAGNHVFTWDKLDRQGNPVTGTPGVDWVIKYLRSEANIVYQSPLIGNSSTVEHGRHKLRSFNPLQCAVLDGNIMTFGCGYAEGISSAHQLLYDNKGEKLNDLLDGIFGENGQETEFICSDGTIVYLAGFDPYNNVTSWVFGVLLNNTTEFEFADGVPYTCSIGRTYNWCIGYMDGGTDEQITGIAVSDSYLYIARGGIDTIQILNKLTGELLVTNTDYTNPRAISIIGDKMTMITGTSGAGDVDTYTLSGTTITLDVSLASLVDPLNTAMSVRLIEYLQSTNSSISGYDTLQTWRPVSTQEVVTVTTTNVSTEYLLKAFNTGAIGLTSIPACDWEFNTYCRASLANQKLVYRVYKRAVDTTETQLFTVTSANMTNGSVPPYDLLTTTSSQGAFTIDPTDIIVVKIYAYRTTGSAATVNIAYDGATYMSYFKAVPTTPYIYIIDGGSSMQIKRYDLAGSSVDTFGTAGGYITNSPAVTNAKFAFDDVTVPYGESNGFRPFILPVFDSTYWVMDPGLERFQHYDSSNTYIERINWLINSYIVMGVTADPTRVFNKLNEYSVPLETPEDAQTPVNYWAGKLTADYFDQWVQSYRQIVEFPNGETYMLLNHPSEGTYELVRLDPTVGIVYLGIDTDADYGTRVWIDEATGDWYWADTTFSVGDPIYIKKRTVTGYSGGGLIPTYSAWAVNTTTPDIVANSVTADASNNIFDTFPVKTLSGKFALYNPEKTNLGYHQNIIREGDNAWDSVSHPATWFGSATDNPYGVPDGYYGGYPDKGYHDIANHVQYAGSRMFTANNFLILLYRGEFWHDTQTNKMFLYNDMGLMVGIIGITADSSRALNDDPYYSAQATPYMVGNAFTAAFFYSGTTLYIRQNDESYQSAVTPWKIENMDSVVVANATIGGTLIDDGYVSLLDDVPVRDDEVLSVGNLVRTPNSQYHNVPSGDNWWNVISGHYSYLPGTNDVSVRGRSTLGATLSFDFEIDPSPVVSSEFTVRGGIILAAPFPTNEDVGIQFQILDDTDKVIARMKPMSYNGFPYPVFRMLMNDDDSMFQLEGYDFSYGPYFKDNADFSIRVYSGGCDFTFGDEDPLTGVALMDPTADRFSPAKVRILIVTTDGLDNWTNDNLMIIKALEIKKE